jgi:RNA polymerase sigma-70 factor (ECF subfamily)
LVNPALSSPEPSHPLDRSAPAARKRARGDASPARLERLVRRELQPVWRLLRRLGLDPAEADDASQQVFLVASRRLGDIDPASERAFLFATAVHVGQKAHRSRARRRETDEVALVERRDSTPGLEELLDRRRARELLDEILGAMSDDLRVVFVLYEIEELTLSEISTALEIPQGTAASRLRRARTDFQSRVARIEAQSKRQGGAP